MTFKNENERLHCPVCQCPGEVGPLGHVYCRGRNCPVGSISQDLWDAIAALRKENILMKRALCRIAGIAPKSKYPHCHECGADEVAKKVLDKLK